MKHKDPHGTKHAGTDSTARHIPRYTFRLTADGFIVFGTEQESFTSPDIVADYCETLARNISQINPDEPECFIEDVLHAIANTLHRYSEESSKDGRHLYSHRITLSGNEQEAV